MAKTRTLCLAGADAAKCAPWTSPIARGRPRLRAGSGSRGAGRPRFGAGEQRRRRPRPGGPAGGRGLPGRLARHPCRESRRRPSIAPRRSPPGMKAARCGRIVNISSGAGLGPSLTGIQAYAAAKAGQINLDPPAPPRIGAIRHHGEQHRAGLLPLESPIPERQWHSYGDARQAALVESIALRRLGTPEDIAHGGALPGVGLCRCPSAGRC